MNPYHARSDYSFWRRSVAGIEADALDPVTSVPFRIAREDRIATAGSCFAQHIARTLSSQGYRYLVTERPEDGAPGENYGVYPARFGNIYTARQLLQTFERAYGLFVPKESVWTRADGAFVDPFRPQIEGNGFPSEEALLEDRRKHLAAVRTMFEECDVFVFTLGLTEGWCSRLDGAVFPVAPGVAGGDFDESRHAFVNFTPEEIVADLKAFREKLRTVNPSVRLIFTVSPVPLVATYEDRHVLVSNTFSKAALRVAADAITREDPRALYFPSFEIITSAKVRSAYFAEDLRSVTDEGVAHVMAVFGKHLLSEGPGDMPSAAPDATAAAADEGAMERLRSYSKVVCEEEAIDA